MRFRVCFAILLNLLVFSKANARFGHHFHSGGVLPYYQTPAWVENNIIEKEPIINVLTPSSHEDVIIALQRIDAIDQRKAKLQEKLDFPGVMSLRYRRKLEKEMSYLNKEQLKIKESLKEYEVLHPFEPQMIVEPFPAYSFYGPGVYRHHYPRFIHRFR
jgi:hypothetical protein